MRRRGLFFEILARDDPKDLLVRDTIARSLSTEAHVLLELGRLEEGEARLRRSLAEWRAYNTMANGRSQADRPGAMRVLVRRGSGRPSPLPLSKPVSVGGPRRSHPCARRSRSPRSCSRSPKVG